ncbi:DUF2062 domain-containing protein [Bacillus sp. MRMR6]|uniref:DUF2062 domain-containing protein n=1 Tax=Bacillus sp. MRMR6 TaxID=1928617 RepID=UPI000951F91F|nr:DUF2062 domain-containing protein [Bacillus sp. MRMR6]OLS33721.1 hypothetical protein BTR25_24495 [Bacillus sp. MRMR6]
MKLRRRIKYYLIRLFRLKASPHQVAMGLSIGFIPNWLPTFGLGPMFSIALAKIARVNLISAFIGGVIGAPFWPIFFLLNYRVGGLFINKPLKVNELEDIEYIEVVNDTVGSLQSGSLQFIAGASINIVISSFLIYLLVFLLFNKYRVSILNKLKL